jgi:hypothetical protein
VQEINSHYKVLAVLLLAGSKKGSNQLESSLKKREETTLVGFYKANYVSEIVVASNNT